MLSETAFVIGHRVVIRLEVNTVACLSVQTAYTGLFVLVWERTPGFANTSHSASESNLSATTSNFTPDKFHISKIKWFSRFVFLSSSYMGRPIGGGNI